MHTSKFFIKVSFFYHWRNMLCMIKLLQPIRSRKYRSFTKFYKTSRFWFFNVRPETIWTVVGYSFNAMNMEFFNFNTSRYDWRCTCNETRLLKKNLIVWFRAISLLHKAKEKGHLAVKLELLRFSPACIWQWLSM